MFAVLPLAFSLAAADAAPPPAAEIRMIPSAYERALAYPSQALGIDLAGEAVLRCRVNSAARPAECSVYSETPRGYGFGRAAMELRSSYRLVQPPPGADPWVLLRVTFDPALRLRQGLANETALR